MQDKRFRDRASAKSRFMHMKGPATANMLWRPSLRITAQDHYRGAKECLRDLVAGCLRACSMDCSRGINPDPIFKAAEPDVVKLASDRLSARVVVKHGPM